MKKIHFILNLTILSLFISTSSAQMTNDHPKGLIYLEADPLAYINKGYSIHPGYENWGLRFDLTFVKVDFPESFEKQFYKTAKFDLITKIHGIKIDYIGKRKNWTKGAFVGVDINRQKLQFTHRTTLSAKNLSAYYAGLRVGYKINIYKGFYITPWTAYWYNFGHLQTYQVNNDKVSTNKTDWILTIHLGYALNL